MERHKCKHCSRTFPNGRALGGHMKAHLATLPLPPKPPPFPSESSSFSYSSSESEQEQEEEQQQQQVRVHSHRESEEKGAVYGLRENPKKSFRVADPEFSFAAAPDAGSVVVQDRESETESKNPTRQRSKRKRRSSPSQNSEKEERHKKPKLSFMELPPPQPQPETEPVLSSVSDTSMVEDVAMFLVMLSRDKWFNKNVVKRDQHQQQEQEQQEEQVEEEEEEREVQRSVVGSKGGIKFKRVHGKHQCENCGKEFRSSRALGSHRSICCRSNESARGGAEGSDRVFQCPFCFKVFGSGQALGGHKRSHLMGMASSSSTANGDSGRLKNSRESFIDLNLPAPAEEEEEDDLGVVSDVSDA